MADFLAAPEIKDDATRGMNDQFVEELLGVVAQLQQVGLLNDDTLSMLRAKLRAMQRLVARDSAGI